MARLLVEIEVPVDPTLVDPDEVAEDIVHEYNAAQQANGQPLADFAKAEWKESK